MLQLLSSIDHPNIIGYKECFIDKDESLCIITTFCEEGDLFNKIRNKANQKQYFTENEIMDMFVQVRQKLQSSCNSGLTRAYLTTLFCPLARLLQHSYTSMTSVFCTEISRRRTFS